MTFSDFVSILDQSINDEYGWANTWESFTITGRWFSISGNKWPNSFDDNTGALKLHPQTVKKLIADDLAEELEYRDAKHRKSRMMGIVKPKPHIKLILTEKGQALVKRKPTYEELELRIIELENRHESMLGIDYDSFTWNREFSSDDMTGLELIRDGLMKALADVHVKIEDAHRQEIKEERDDAIAYNKKLREENKVLAEQCDNAESQLGIAFEIMFDSQIAEYQHLFEKKLNIEHSDSNNQTEGEN